jgi:hypothetical protein
MNESQCFLSSMALDLVTETDHLNNYCLCSKCTCGQHKCPRPAAKLYPKSIFNSYYKLNYKRHSVSQRPVQSATPQRKNIFKLESETTQSLDYKPYAIETPKSTKIQQASVPSSRYKLSSKSTYNQDFANWGHIKAESTKVTRVHKNSGVKFSGLSTYASCYQTSPTIPVKIIKPVLNTNILCSGSATKTPETVMRSSYNYTESIKNIPSQPIHRPDHTMALPAFHNQYSTTNSINFNQKDIINTIRRARKSIE